MGGQPRLGQGSVSDPAGIEGNGPTWVETADGQAPVTGTQCLPHTHRMPASAPLTCADLGVVFISVCFVSRHRNQLRGRWFVKSSPLFRDQVWDFSQGLLTPSPLGALGSAHDWLQIASGAAGQETAGWTDGQAPRCRSPSPPLLHPLCPGQRQLTLHTPSPEAPGLSALAVPQEGRGGAAPGWRQRDLPSTPQKDQFLPAPSEHKSCTIQKSVTYLQPAPDGPALCQPAPTAEPRGRGGTASGQEPTRPDPCPQAIVRARQEGPRGSRASPAAPTTVPSAWHCSVGARAGVGLGAFTPNPQGPFPVCFHSTHRHTHAHMRTKSRTTHPHTHKYMHTHARTRDAMNYMHTHTCIHSHTYAHPYTRTLTYIPAHTRAHT